MIKIDVERITKEVSK